METGYLSSSVPPEERGIGRLLSHPFQFFENNHLTVRLHITYEVDTENIKVLAISV
jgi:hypothetical protein